MSKSGYGKAFKKAFPFTIPVLTGYLFIGIAFGVLIQNIGYNAFFAGLMSLTIYAGSGQYLLVDLLANGTFWATALMMELLLHVRQIFYGLSMFDKFSGMGIKKIYMMFALTDETYSLLYATPVPEDVDEKKFYFAISVLDQSYWIMGSIIGALAGSLIPENLTRGIDFAMTALFIVILVEQWSVKERRPAAATGMIIAIISLVIFGPKNFIPPAMAVIIGLLLLYRKLSWFGYGAKEGGTDDAE